MFVLSSSSLSYNPRVACERACVSSSAKTCVFSCVFPFLPSCFLIIYLVLVFFLSLPVLSFDFDLDFSTSSCCSHPVLVMVGTTTIIKRSSRFLWRLVQRTACISYVRARTSLFVTRYWVLSKIRYINNWPLFGPNHFYT